MAAGSLQTQYALWFPISNKGQKGTVLDLLRPAGRGELSESYSQRTVIYVADDNGNPVSFNTEQAPPGESPTTTFTIFQEAQLKFLEEMANRNQIFHGQLRLVTCGSIDNPTAWSRLWHLAEMNIQSKTIGEGPTAVYGGANVTTEMPATPLAVVDIVRLFLANQSSGEANNILGIDGLKDLTSCGAGYPGADKILIAGAASAGGGVTAKVIGSVNGGGAWFTLTNAPFAVDLDVGRVQIRQYSNGFRIIAPRATTVVASPAAIAHATSASFDQTTIQAVTWTTVSIGSTNGEFITALAWLEQNRCYAGTSGGDVYISTDQGLTWTRIYDGSTQINGFARDKDGNVWAVGATNTILKESVANRGSMVVKNGPSGGGAFFSIAVANDGTLIAGNGTNIVRSDNNAETAGGWRTAVALGANRQANAVFFEGEDKLLSGCSELVRAIVDSTTGGNGLLYESVDGGNSWQAYDALTNTGYNTAYKSKYGNFYLIAADAGVIQRASM